MGERPSGTIAFLFTDVEGSTRLWEEHDHDMDGALAAHDGILRDAIAAESGYVFSTQGDAFAAAFDSAAAAARAAVSIQRALAAHEWPNAAGIKVRIGLHVGEAHERDGDYFGPTLNRAARIMSAAHGGQTVCSAAFAALAQFDRMVDLGEHRLKDLAAPEHVWQLGDGDHPPLQTLDLVRHNLPVERTPLFGREGVLAEIGGRLGEYRLVSVLGMGGTGKTRVAVAAAADVIERFPDGVWFVDLVPAGDDSDVAEAVAGAAGYRVGGADLLGSLTEVLRDRRALFVLDNCEHITDTVAEMLDVVLGQTAAPRFLVTSREPLGLLDEYQLTLEPLAVAADAASPAVALFMGTAARVGARLGAGDLARIASVCDHLDGHPLSIELAAAQLRQLTVNQLAARLEDRFELLARGRSSSRQASLVAVLEDTWAMLEPEGQRLLVQLGAFPAGFGLDEIEQVAAGLDVGAVGRTVGGLVERNLVVNDGAGGYRLLETVKLFAQRQPGADGAAERHTQWVLDSLRAQPEDAWHSSMSLSAWILRHDDDWRTVEDRLVARRRWVELSDLLNGSGGFFHNRIPGAAAMALIRRIEGYLEQVDPTDRRTLIALHLAAGYAGLSARRPDWIQRGGNRAVELTVESSPVERAVALILGSWMAALRDADSAISNLRDAFDIADSSGASGVANIALAYQGVHHALAGRVDEVHELLERLESRLETLDPNDDQLARYLTLVLRLAVGVVADPEQGRRAAKRWGESYFESPVGFGVLDTAAAAGVGDIAGTRWRMGQAIHHWEERSADDGFPDWLLPLAVLAHATGDVERCRTLVTAIRRSPVPTHNFLHTIIYRQLRDRVGLATDNPLDSHTIEEIFGDTMTWMDSLDDSPDAMAGSAAPRKTREAER